MGDGRGGEGAQGRHWRHAGRGGVGRAVKTRGVIILISRKRMGLSQA